jgi:hypothetical protein
MLKKLASGVANLSGGNALVDYAGTKIAQRKNPELKQYIPQTTTGKQALKSAGQVAGTIAALTGVGGAGRALTMALRKKAVPKTNVMKKKIPTNAKDFSVDFQKQKVKINQSNKGGHEIPLRKTWDEGGW